MTTTTVSIDLYDTVLVFDTNVKYVGTRWTGGVPYRKVCIYPPWLEGGHVCEYLDIDDVVSSTDPDDSENWVKAKLLSGSDSRISVEVERHKPPAAPTISAISWSPAGDFTKLAAGASIDGDTETLLLVATDPDDVVADLPVGEAMLQITDADGNLGDAFTVAVHDRFRFDDKEWFVLHIVCGPDCDFIILADETAEAAATPHTGDEIQFTCTIDWHDIESDWVKWYYAKPPAGCFTLDDLDWTLFATGDMPAHNFDDPADADIVFLKVVASNVNSDLGEFGDVCDPAFNIWETNPNGLLEIQFNSGSIYQYKNIPREIYDALMDAASKGKYFWETIREERIKYPYKRVR